MSRLIAGATLLALFLTPLRADDKASEKSSRAGRLQVIQDEYGKALDDMREAIRVGTIKPNADGDNPQWSAMQNRFAKPVRQLIDANPADAVALDAIVFCLNDLGMGDAEPGLYELVLKHHAGSDKIAPLLRQPSAPANFLPTVAAKSPHAMIRLWATYHLAVNLYEGGKRKEAEPLLEALGRDPSAKELGGYGIGTLADSATRLLFEVRRLNVGQEIPEIIGVDLDGKPMKLSESRGKITLIVFWATWCIPCMAMVPHERALAERYAEGPFVIVGVNGDALPDGPIRLEFGGEVIDRTDQVKAAVERERMTWRSFRNGNFGVGTDWNVRIWPTVYLIDQHGIIRGKWKGNPGDKKLDAAVEKLMNIAEAERNRAGK